MSRLNVDPKSVQELFADKKADFLIPDYQRPYAWDIDQCLTLWDDIFSFAFPDSDSTKFNQNEEYYLGPIVTFKNSDGKSEVIDGQQRLTTLMLLLRAFYSMFSNMQDQNSINTKKMIEQCIWKTDEFGNPLTDELKIDSQVATDDDKGEFLSILKTGLVESGMKSRYAKNYRLFQSKIDEFLHSYPSYFPYLPARILQNCILLPIEADDQNTALRIFSTLNDRGLPLSDADIFKAQFYNYFGKEGLKDQFVSKWKDLDALCNEIFHPISGTPMDELFTRYMYYERAKQGIKNSTTEALRQFYSKNNYSLLKSKQTFENLILLADFWKDVYSQDDSRFTDGELKKLSILNAAPNGMWAYFVSVYFMAYKAGEGNHLEPSAFESFLSKTIAFVWYYAITNPGVNSLRTPIYAEMINLVNHSPLTFQNAKKSTRSELEIQIDNYSFLNGRPITKSMLTWWAYQIPGQDLLPFDTVFEIEHIFAKNRQINEKSLTDSKSLESLGNKVILEKRINIRASDYRYQDKIKYYQGFTNGRGKKKEGTLNKELALLSFDSSRTDFTESDIAARYSKIKKSFLDFVEAEGLLN